MQGKDSCKSEVRLVGTIASLLFFGAAGLGCGEESLEKGDDLDPAVNDTSADSYSNTAIHRGAIEFGVPVVASFDESSHHLYNLTAPGAVSVDIALAGAGGSRLDTVLRVYGPRDEAGNLPEAKIAYDDDGGGALSSRISGLQFASGTYAIVASIYGGRAAPGRAYRLEATCSGGACDGGEQPPDCDVWVASPAEGGGAFAYDFSEQGAVKRCEAQLGSACRARCEYGPNGPILWFKTRKQGFYAVLCQSRSCKLAPRSYYSASVQVDKLWFFPNGPRGDYHSHYDCNEPSVNVTNGDWYGLVSGFFGSSRVEGRKKVGCVKWTSLGYVLPKRIDSHFSSPGAPVRLVDETSEAAEAACNDMSDEPCQTTCTTPIEGCEAGYYPVDGYCERADELCAAACGPYDCDCMLNNDACTAAYANHDCEIGVWTGCACSGDHLLIEYVAEGTGAQLAGLDNGDRILSVDGESLYELGCSSARSRMLGPFCTTVRLTVKWRATHPDHPGMQQSIDVLRVTRYGHN